MNSSYINIHYSFKKYHELNSILSNDYFINILYTHTNKFIDPETTLAIMFSEEGRYQAEIIKVMLTKDRIFKVIDSDYIIRQDRIYLKVNES